MAATSNRARPVLLERARFVAVLDSAFAHVSRQRSGRLVLIGGEAGIGKTSLVRAFCERHGASTRLLWGGCEALFTPRPLGPLADIAAELGGELAATVDRGGRPHLVVAELLRQLRELGPAIVVLEDLHWADEATLDVVRLLDGRVQSAPALVVATFRDDELGAAHPLRIVLGELSTAARLNRLELPRLSRLAVAELANPHRVDLDRLYRQTGGNPLFVTEVLATAADELPVTVRDAVLARAARAGEAARTLLEAVAIVPPEAELWLLERLMDGDLSHLEACLESGVLAHDERRIGFRHELARLAVEESIPPHRRVELHRRAVAALAAPPAGERDLSRLAHHADAADDAEAVLEFAPAAAERAARLGAHREAAAQFARALRFSSRLAPERRAQLLDRRAYECYLTNRLEEALDVHRERLELYRTLGDRRHEGDALRWISRLLGLLDRREEAEGPAMEAVRVLEQLEPARELALAYYNVAGLRMLAGANAEAVAWASRTLELAERLGELGALTHALITIGSAEFSSGVAGATARLERALELARAAGLDEQVASALDKLAYIAVHQRELEAADRYVAEGLEFTAERDLAAWRGYLIAVQAASALARGRWNEAAEAAAAVLALPWTLPHVRLSALVVVGRLNARRGHADPWAPLDEAAAIEAAFDDLDRLGPVAVARAEAAVLTGDPAPVAESTDRALALALRRGDPWWAGELACWRRRAGIEEEAPEVAAEPFALELAGAYERAAAVWSELGCPYDAAVALGQSDDEESLRRAAAELGRIGAERAADAVARRARERGLRFVRRPPRAVTRGNPAGLTARELDVLRLVASGLRNQEIAARLFLSTRTVDHHVSSILRKLEVETRVQVGAAAERLGVLAAREE